MFKRRILFSIKTFFLTKPKLNERKMTSPKELNRSYVSHRRIVLTCAFLTFFLLTVPLAVALYKMGVFSNEPSVSTKIKVHDGAPVLKIVGDIDFKPMSYLKSDGSYAGSDIEVAIEIANRLGMKPEFFFTDWITARNTLNSGNANIILGLEIFLNMKGVLKTSPIVNDQLYVYGKSKVTDAAALYGKKIALMNRFVIMSMFDLNCEFVEYYTCPEILNALEKGEVDFAICHASVADCFIKDNNLNIVNCFPLMESFLTIGVREDEAELHDKINAVLQEMAYDGTLNRMKEKWITSNENFDSFFNVIKNNLSFFIAYLIGFVLLEFLISIIILQSKNYSNSIKYTEKIKEQYTLLRSMADIYVSAHLIHLKENTFSEIGMKPFLKPYLDSSNCADRQMKNIIRNSIASDMIDSALEFTDLKTVSERMGDNKILSQEFLGVHIGWVRAQFVAVGYDSEKKVTDVVFTTTAIDQEKKKEAYLIRMSNSDALTGLYNRHAFETDANELRKKMREDLIVFSFDSNGLKKINDTYGHSAGDKLLRLAGICIDYSFGKYGKVYRYGGDEFIALIYVDSRKINHILDKFKKKIAVENREFKYELSIACGFASHAENKNLTIDELIQTADKKMYIEKESYHKNQSNLSD